MKKKWIYVIIYGVIIIMLIIATIISICYIIKNELSVTVILQILPIYLGGISFFTKYLVDLFKYENENKKYWFRKYILENNLELFNQFIDETKILFAEALQIKNQNLGANITTTLYKKQTQEKYDTIADEFNNKWSECISKLEFIKIYNKSLYVKLNENFEKAQDLFMIELDGQANSLDFKNSSVFSENIEDIRTDILKTLYKYSID